MFGTHNIFQFHIVLLGFETHSSIVPVDVFSRQIRHAEFDDFGMKIRGDDAIALSLIRDGQGHQSGILTIAW